MTDRPHFTPGNGISLSEPPRQDDPFRHDVVRQCRFTTGYGAGGEIERSICLEDASPNDLAVTHCECVNAFHDQCFADWLARNTNLLTPDTLPSKCPMCNGLLYLWPELIRNLPPAEVAAREGARRVARREQQREEARDAVLFRQELARGEGRREAQRYAGLEPASLADLDLGLGVWWTERRYIAAHRGDLQTFIRVSRCRRDLLATFMRDVTLGGDEATANFIAERLQLDLQENLDLLPNLDPGIRLDFDRADELGANARLAAYGYGEYHEGKFDVDAQRLREARRLGEAYTAALLKITQDAWQRAGELDLALVLALVVARIQVDLDKDPAELGLLRRARDALDRPQVVFRGNVGQDVDQQ